MSKFDPPKPQALTPSELVQAIARFGADAAGVSKAVELIQIQEQLKSQDEADIASWVAQMVADGSDRAITALRSAGFDESGVFFGADIAPIDIAEPLPESETRVENKRIILETGLEGQFARPQNSAEQLTRYGRPLSSPAAALETATADMATSYQPKTRFLDELPILAAGIGLATTFALSLSGNSDAVGLAIGFFAGSLLAFGLTRFGKGFPGIFALTTFGVVGARFLRGFLSSVSAIALLAFVPAFMSPAKSTGLPENADLLLWGGLVIIATVTGLAISGKRVIALRLSFAAFLLLIALAIALLSAINSGVALDGLTAIGVVAGSVIGFLLNSSLAFSTTVGGVRFHLLQNFGTSLVFGLFLVFLQPAKNGLSAQLLLATIALAIALSFAASSTSKGRFWSGLAGATAGVSAVSAILYLPGAQTITLAFVAALMGAWLAMIGFDSFVRRGRLHLASLNRSFGFYGPISWLAILVLFFSGLLGGSLALFSPITALIPGVLGSGIVSFVLALVFSLIRLPEIRAQEEEIMLAVSRVSAGNQVGIS